MVDVYLWMYHTDLWAEFFSLLYPIRHDIVLHLGLCAGNSSDNIIQEVESNFLQHKITYHRNAGGDILPFITDFSNNSNKQDLFIKLHTKKSKLLNRIQWREVLLNSLLGPGGKTFYANKEYLSQTHNIGAITHRGLILKNQEGANTNKINELLLYYNISRDKLKHRSFAAGTMFMAKSELYNIFFNQTSLNYLTTKLEQETGQVSDIRTSKYCHSLERIFGYICEYKQQKISWPKYHTIPIINAQSPTHRLHLTITYNNYAYIEENIGVHGQVLHRSEDSFTIEWYHLSKAHIRNYKKIGHSTYIGY